MRAVYALATALFLLGAREWQPNGWLKALQDVAVAREHRPVRIALVSDRDANWQTTSDYGFRTVLRDPVTRARVFAPGTMGYTFIPPRPKPVSVFVNRDRVDSRLVRLVAAHELGHVLLHGFTSRWMTGRIRAISPRPDSRARRPATEGPPTLSAAPR